MFKLISVLVAIIGMEWLWYYVMNAMSNMGLPSTWFWWIWGIGSLLLLMNLLQQLGGEIKSALRSE